MIIIAIEGTFQNSGVKDYNVFHISSELLMGVVLKRAEDAGPDKARISLLPTKPKAELLSPQSTVVQGGVIHLCRAVPKRSLTVGGWVAPKLTHPVILFPPACQKPLHSWHPSI